MVGSHPQLVPMLGLYYYDCAMHPLCGAARQEEQRKSAYTHPELLIDKVSDEIAVDGCKNIWNPTLSSHLQQQWMGHRSSPGFALLLAPSRSDGDVSLRAAVSSHVW